MDDIMQRIRSSYTALPNAKKTVASFFLNHFEQLQFLTVTELAEKVGVSDTTIINFCKDMGYAGYAAMKRAVREVIQTGGENAMAPGQGDSAGYIQELLSRILNDMHATFEDPQNLQAIGQATDLMAQANCIHAVGFWHSACEAQALCLELRRQQRKAQAIFPDMSDYIDKVLLVEPGDVVVLYDLALYLAALTEICVLLKKKQIPIILVTDMGPCPRVTYADVVIRCRNTGRGISPVLCALSKVLVNPLRLPDEQDYDAIREGVFSRFNSYGVPEPREGRNERI